MPKLMIRFGRMQNIGGSKPLEQTRGNFLDYGAPTQQSFTDELREIIGDAAEVGATLESSVTIARRR